MNKIVKVRGIFKVDPQAQDGREQLRLGLEDAETYLGTLKTPYAFQPNLDRAIRAVQLARDRLCKATV